MKKENKQRVVVVTGASAGVGRAAVREFAKEGALIGLLAREESRLNAAKREVAEIGGRALALPTDVADASQVKSAALRVEEEFGPIDVWVNNAMTTIFAPFDEITPEEFRRATEVTYLGCVYGTMCALKQMKPRNHGTIVQVGSALAFRSIPLQAPYCGAKHAIVGFTDSIRCELIHDRSGVHITTVHLPAMNTPQFSWGKTRLPRHPQPVPPIYDPEVAARAIVWASSHKRRDLWVGWPTYEAIIGQRVAPGFADKYLADHAFQGQQTSEPVSEDRPDNLFEPVHGNYAADGVFSERARNWAITNKLDLNPLGLGWVLSLGLAAAGLAIFSLKKKI
jgi:NAD(P)-dependent dehydrogenase (short-subunit alcohol dehydrogenase family)